MDFPVNLSWPTSLISNYIMPYKNYRPWVVVFHCSFLRATLGERKSEIMGLYLPLAPHACSRSLAVTQKKSERLLAVIYQDKQKKFQRNHCLTFYPKSLVPSVASPAKWRVEKRWIRKTSIKEYLGSGPYLPQENYVWRRHRTTRELGVAQTSNQIYWLKEFAF